MQRLTACSHRLTAYSQKYHTADAKGSCSSALSNVHSAVMIGTYGEGPTFSIVAVKVAYVSQKPKALGTTGMSEEVVK